MNVSSSISRKKMKSFFPKNHDFNFNHVIIEVITRCLRHHPNEGVPKQWRYQREDHFGDILKLLPVCGNLQYREVPFSEQLTRSTL